jgi:glycosyltransferase involved in cell wall biosynthesis
MSPGILMLAGESPLPPTSGLRQRVLHLARALGTAFELELVVLGDAPADAGEPFALRGVPHRRSRRSALAASLLQPYEAAKVSSTATRRIVESGRWASVQIELPFIAPSARHTRSPVVLDAHNVERDVLEGLARTDPRPLHRARWRWEAHKTERLERSVVAAATAVCATSQEDAAVLEQLGARRIVLVPNGVDCAGVPYARPGSNCRLVYVGHYGYRPNLLAAVELVDEILPRVRETLPEATVTLVGREAERRLGEKVGEAVRLAGDVPEVLPHLRSARALVLPLRSGSGTRLKVLEALAAGVPVVSTPLGVAGLGLRDGVEVLLGESPAELAQQTLRVLSNDGLANRLSEDGRRLVAARYDWSVVARPLVELHGSLGAEAVR